MVFHPVIVIKRAKSESILPAIVLLDYFTVLPDIEMNLSLSENIPEDLKNKARDLMGYQHWYSAKKF